MAKMTSSKNSRKSQKVYKMKGCSKTRSKKYLGGRLYESLAYTGNQKLPVKPVPNPNLAVMTGGLNIASITRSIAPTTPAPTTQAPTTPAPTTPTTTGASGVSSILSRAAGSLRSITPATSSRQIPTQTAEAARNEAARNAEAARRAAEAQAQAQAAQAASQATNRMRGGAASVSSYTAARDAALAAQAQSQAQAAAVRAQAQAQAAQSAQAAQNFAARTAQLQAELARSQAQAAARSPPTPSRAISSHSSKKGGGRSGYPNTGSVPPVGVPLLINASSQQGGSCGCGVPSLMGGGNTQHRDGCKCSNCKEIMTGGSAGFVGSAWTPTNEGNYYALNTYKPDVSRQMLDLGANPPFNNLKGGKKRKNRKQRGGALSNFMSQDLVNFGRQVQFGVGSAYSAFSGTRGPVSPLPWRDQFNMKQPFNPALI